MRDRHTVVCTGHGAREGLTSERTARTSNAFDPAHWLCIETIAEPSGVSFARSATVPIRDDPTRSLLEVTNRGDRVERMGAGPWT